MKFSTSAKITIAALVAIFLAVLAVLYFVSEEKLVMPDLNKPIVITAKLGEESVKKARESIAASQKALKKNPDLYDQWMNLALYRKLIGDYGAAREIWEYVAKIRPLVGLPYHNLGNLYLYELKNPDKAESYYLKAVEIEPEGIQFYITAYEYYRFVKKNLNKAREILKKGITANPTQAQVLANILSSF